MQTVKVDLKDRSYNIHIENGLLNKTGDLISTLPVRKNIAIITNKTIAPLYLDIVKTKLKKTGFNVHVIILPDGEEHKNLNTITNIYNELIMMDFDRNSSIIALGGGVVGDMAGFAAATFFRGIPYIQIPTTLLSQVDSSVGGKTGVNLPGGKNLVGAFYQPKLVIIDPEVLKTLQITELRAGIAEVIKYGVILNNEFFKYLELNIDQAVKLDDETIAYIIKTSCSIKADITTQDEKEKGIRSFLNFGHTIGHAVETLTNYNEFTHGEAVAIGMAAISKLSEFWRFTDIENSNRLIALLQKSGLPTELPAFSLNDYIDTMMKDKKRAEAGINMVLMKQIGEVFLKLKTADELSLAMQTALNLK
jgi:3-dehydroquinate synthase